MKLLIPFTLIGLLVMASIIYTENDLRSPTPPPKEGLHFSEKRFPDSILTMKDTCNSNFTRVECIELLTDAMPIVSILNDGWMIKFAAKATPTPTPKISRVPPLENMSSNKL